ncbi:kinase-like domain-containing protein [Thelephora terrestris]|uniref:Kinase-like domain-containing protein n=1 Tax=Thelephora terrestris TaxID=56493 RepID=A0A9P6L2V5_9AGAM|nr:kinase-like domain-containing protein [Thelephora terrestris]
MPAYEVLQQLYSLDPSSPDFLRVLYALIRNDEDEQYSSSLGGEELTRLVDFLDNALSLIPTSDDVFRRCLRKLRAICGFHTILPSSHIINGDLTRVGISAIAFGGFADVWQGDQGGNRVCIKVLRIAVNDTDGLKKLFFKEAVVWKRLRHPNVVPFLGVTLEPLQFVSEWLPNGTLTHYVTNNPSANRIALLLDVAEGLNYLHASYTIHGDLKGPNILIKANGHACLADFGLASIVHGNDSMNASKIQGYSERWTAPEILSGAEKITREADVFSFGMVVIGTFTGKNPFSEFNAHTVVFKTMNRERPTYPRGTEALGFVTPIWHMTVDCWHHDPAHRPMMAAVVEFLRDCYTLHTVDPLLSTLSPWNPTVNASPYEVISPIPTDDNGSPTWSMGTSHVLFSGTSPSSFNGSFSEESPGYSVLDRPPSSNGHGRPTRPFTTGNPAPLLLHITY